MDEPEIINNDSSPEVITLEEIQTVEEENESYVHKTHGHEIFIAIVTAIIFIALGYSYKVLHHKKVDLRTQLMAQVSQNQETNSQPFPNVSINAKAVYVWDVANNQALFKENEQLPLPLASLTKIMMADTALDIVSPTSTIFISKDALDSDGDTGLYLNESWFFKDLLNYTLTVSSNDGATAIAEFTGAKLSHTSDQSSEMFSQNQQRFVDQMNTNARKIGLSNTHFLNPTGLDIDTAQAGAYGSAQDIAKLFAYNLKNHPEILENTKYPRITVTSESNFKHVGINTDIAIDQIPGIIASKTGYSDLAGGNLAVIYDAGINHPIVVVILGSTYDGRFADMLELIKATNQYISLQN